MEIADNTEQKLWKEWNRAVLGQIAMAENDFNPGWPDSARSMVLVSKDDEAEQFNALVIDRVFVPPKGFGEPVSRRSFIAWLPNASYGVLAITESSDHTVGTFANYDRLRENDELHPRTLLVAPHARTEDWWLGREGRVVIEPLESSTTCPFGNGGGADSTGLLTCDVVTYTVQLEGELVRRLDARNSLIPEALKQRHRLAVPSQRVRGIRFTIHCHPTEIVWQSPYQLGCTNPFIFWRNNALFARSLGVDISQMKRLNHVDNEREYGRTVQAGSDRQPDGPRTVRWKLYDTDGTLVDQDTRLDYTPSPEFKPTNDQSGWVTVAGANASSIRADTRAGARITECSCSISRRQRGNDACRHCASVRRTRCPRCIRQSP
jgi:hypothetical protein